MRIETDTIDGNIYAIRREDGVNFVAALASLAKLDPPDSFTQQHWIVWPVEHIDERLYFSSLDQVFNHIIDGWRIKPAVPLRPQGVASGAA